MISNSYIVRQLIVASCIYFGHFISGFVSGWPSNATVKLQDPNETPLPEVITDVQASWVASTIFVGSILGPYLAAFLSNIKGRKPCLILGGTAGVIAFLVIGFAKELWLIYIGRAIVGLSVGVISIINFVYLAEIASANIRGILMTTLGIFNALGLVFAYSIGSFISFAWLSYVGIILMSAFTVATLFLPETPMFYLIKGQEKEATHVLNFLGRSDDINELLAVKETEPTSYQKVWTTMFKVKSNRKALFIVITLHILQMLSGILVIMFFATTIFDLAESSLEPHISTIILGMTQLIASFITPLFIERSGRKIVLLFSTAACFVSLALLGTYFYLDHINNSAAENLRWLPLVCLVGYFISYNCGFGIIPSTLMGEMLDSVGRGPGSVFTVTIGWSFGFVISSTFGYIITSIGVHVAFWTYSIICVFAFIFTAVYVPETKGKSLIKIQEMLSQ